MLWDVGVGGARKSEPSLFVDRLRKATPLFQLNKQLGNRVKELHDGNPNPGSNTQNRRCVGKHSGQRMKTVKKKGAGYLSVGMRHGPPLSLDSCFAFYSGLIAWGLRGASTTVFILFVLHFGVLLLLVPATACCPAPLLLPLPPSLPPSLLPSLSLSSLALPLADGDHTRAWNGTMTAAACGVWLFRRRLEAELGSWPYLLASAHLVVLSEVLEKMFMHVLLKTGRVV